MWRSIEIFGLMVWLQLTPKFFITLLIAALIAKGSTLLIYQLWFAKSYFTFSWNTAVTEDYMNPWNIDVSLDYQYQPILEYVNLHLNRTHLGYQRGDLYTEQFISKTPIYIGLVYVITTIVVSMWVHARIYKKKHIIPEFTQYRVGNIWVHSVILVESIIPLVFTCIINVCITGRVSFFNALALVLSYNCIFYYQIYFAWLNTGYTTLLVIICRSIKSYLDLSMSVLLPPMFFVSDFDCNVRNSNTLPHFASVMITSSILFSIVPIVYGIVRERLLFSGEYKDITVHGVEIPDMKDPCIVHLVGANGSGKTTILKKLMGEYGNPMTVRKYYSKPNMVPVVTQFDAFPDDAKVNRLVYLYIAIHGADIQDTANLKSEFPILHRLWDRKVVTCSGGERQMVHIFLNLISPTNMCIMDEPLIGLDQENRKIVSDFINKKDRSYLMTHHRVEGEPMIFNVDHTVALPTNNLFNMDVITTRIINGYSIGYHWFILKHLITRLTSVRYITIQLLIIFISIKAYMTETGTQSIIINPSDICVFNGTHCVMTDVKDRCRVSDVCMRIYGHHTEGFQISYRTSTYVECARYNIHLLRNTSFNTTANTNTNVDYFVVFGLGIFIWAGSGATIASLIADLLLWMPNLSFAGLIFWIVLHYRLYLFCIFGNILGTLGVMLSIDIAVNIMISLFDWRVALNTIKIVDMYSKDEFDYHFIYQYVVIISIVFIVTNGGRYLIEMWRIRKFIKNIRPLISESKGIIKISGPNGAGKTSSIKFYMDTSIFPCAYSPQAFVHESESRLFTCIYMLSCINRDYMLLPQSLSGGEKRIFQIAHTLLSGRKVIVLDEPFESLDSTNIDIVASWIKAVADTKLVIIIDHLNVINMCNKVIYITSKSAHC